MQGVRLFPLETDGVLRTVHVGTMAMRVPVLWRPAHGWLELPAELLQRLGVAPGGLLHAWFDPSGGHVHLGPVVAVLLGSKAYARLGSEGEERYRALYREAREASLLPVICAAGSLNPEAGTVTGWVERNDEWIEAELPIPDVVYNRATFPDRGERAAAAALLRDLQVRHGVHLINSKGAFSKSQVADSLRFFPETAELTPDTVPFSDCDPLTTMLARYPGVFVKAEHSSHGSDVLRVRGGQDGWQVRGRFRGRAVDELFASPGEACGFLRLLTAAGEWVVQQAIEVPEIDERVCDVRTIAQRDGNGAWQVNMVIVRRALVGSVAANMARGGEPLSPELFWDHFGDQYPGLADLRWAATDATLKAAIALEARLGRLGEIGVDIGLDRHGRPWVLEANAKPLHPTLPGLHESLRRSPFGYAVHLAGRNWAGQYSGLQLPEKPE